MGRHSRKNSKSNRDGDDTKSDVSDEDEPKVKSQKRASESDKSDENLEAKINRIVDKKTAAYKEEIELLKANQYACPWAGNCPCCNFWGKGQLKMDSGAGGSFRGRGSGGPRGNRGYKNRGYYPGSGQWRGSNWRGGYFS